MFSTLKALLSITTIVICLYGASVFGLSLWPVVFLALSAFLLLSLFFPMLDAIAMVIGRTMGVLSLVALALLLLAATTGGGFRMSDDNLPIAAALALMAVFGCAFFLVRTSRG